MQPPSKMGGGGGGKNFWKKICWEWSENFDFGGVVMWLVAVMSLGVREFFGKIQNCIITV